MKNLLNFFILLGGLASFYACSNQESTGSGDTGSVLYSESYKPNIFEDDMRVERIKELAPEFQQLIEKKASERHIPGIAYGIVVDDELILASSTGLINLKDSFPATTRSAFRIASMTKSFTAMAILMWRDNGQLSLNDPVSRYIPET